MTDTDLPLFAWQPPAKVLVFPLVKRTSRIRQTAHKLATKHGEDATLYWKQVAASQRKHLHRIGLPSEDVERELRSFFDAVQCQMARMAYERQPGGAA